jgi:hypothetical protein
MPTATDVAPSATAKKSVTATRPFRAGVQTVDEGPYDHEFTLKSGTQSLSPQYEVPATGFLNCINVLVEATVTGQSVNDVAFNEDGPFNVFDSIQFTDVGNQPIIGPMTGYDLMLLNKFGGYLFQDDPKASPIYSAITGTGSTAGSFTFLLRLPIELVPRDALGTLQNLSQSTPFKVKGALAALDTIYSTAPSVAPVVRIRMAPESYWVPQTADLNGNPLAQKPPGNNTTQFWNVTDYTVASGTVTQSLTASTGFPLRNLIFVLRGADGLRSTGETDWPDPFTVKAESNMTVDRIKLVWQDQIAKWYDYDGPVGDTKRAKDNGVYVIPYCRDFYPKPGWETRRGYFPTSDGMRFDIKGKIGGAGLHKINVLTNYVAPGPGVTLASITA